MLSRRLVTLAILLITTNISTAQLSGSFPVGGGNITIEPTDGPIQAGGLEFVAEPGILTQGASPAPFPFFIPNSASPGNVTFGVLGTPVTIDGPVELDLAVSALATGADIAATWGNGIVPTPFPINGFFEGQPILSGSFPFDGGPITVAPTSIASVSLDELNLRADAGVLTGGGSAAPFESLNSNTSELWSVGSNTAITIDGAVTLDVTASADASVSGSATNGFGSAVFSVTRLAPEFTPNLLASFNATSGGPIAIQAPNGPVTTRGLDFQANVGTLFTGGGNAAPFETLTNNTETQWTVNSNNDVTIDGSLILDVAASGFPGFQAFANDGITTTEFAVERRGTPTINASFPFVGGPVTISGNGVPVNGLELRTTRGSLTGGGSAAPFDNLLTNTGSEWSANSAVGLIIDGDVELDLIASSDTFAQGRVFNDFDEANFGLLRERPDFTDTLRGSYPFNGGPITISTTDAPVSLRGMAIESQVGLITGGGDPAPFTELTANTTQRWVARSSADVTIDGSVTLDLTTTGGSRLNGFALQESSAAQFTIEENEPTGAVLRGSFLNRGGPITIAPTDGPLSMLGIEFRATRGTLTGGGSAAPFDTLLNNTPEQWTVGSLARVTIDGPVTLDVVASPEALIDGLWGNGSFPLPFEVVSTNPVRDLVGSFPFDGGPITLSTIPGSNPVVTRGLDITAVEGSLAGGGNAAPYQTLENNTSQRWTANSAADVTIDGSVTLDVAASFDAVLDAQGNNAIDNGSFSITRNDPIPSDRLTGSFPSGGGAISIRPTADPVSLRRLSIAGSGGGRLTTSDNPAPFETLIESDRANWIAESNTDVVIDGIVTLDVETNSFTGSYEGLAFDGSTTSSFDITERPFNSLFILASHSRLGGPVSLESVSPGQIQAIELIARSGSLTGGGDASPFANIDANTPQRWAASSTAPITLDGTVVLDVVASFGATIDGNWSDEFVQNPLPVFAASVPITNTLRGTFPSDGGPITLSSTAPFTATELGLTAAQGTLTSGGSAMPFDSVTESSESQWVARSNAAVTIDGNVTLDVFASENSQVQGLVRDGENNPFEFFLRQQTQTLSGSYDFDGGPITIQSSGAIATRGLSLNATTGSITGGGSAAPYDTLVTNTANQWSANSSAFVTLDGTVVLDVVASSDANINGEYTDGLNSKPFELTRNAPGRTTNLRGNFPFEGGPITIESVGSPVLTRGLDFNATRGTITGGGSAAPYETLTNNEVSRWTVASSTDVIIDGSVELDVMASNDAQLQAFVTDGTTTNQFSIGRTGPVTGADTRLIGTFPPEGGNITLTTTLGPIETAGVQFEADPGQLTQGVIPVPFSFFIPIPGTTGTVVLGTLGTPITLDGSIELDVSAQAGSQIEGQWGDGIVPVSFPVSDGSIVISTESSLVGSVPFDGGAITLSPQNGPVSARGLNIEATFGTLTGGGSAAPFETLATNTAQQWTVESNADVMIDGPVELDVIASKAANLVGSATVLSDVVSPISFVRDEPTSTDRIFGSYSEAGGPISIVAPNGPVSTRSLDLHYQLGAPSSLESGGSAAPYERVVTDSGQRWTATSDVDVIIDGIVTLDVDAVTTPRFADTLSGLVDDGTTTSSFVVLERAPIAGITGSFPFDGGAITLAGNGQRINSILLSTTVGSLNSGGDAAPLSSVTENSSQQWSVRSDVSVAIDGLITLDVLASADAQINGMVSDEFTQEPISVVRRGPEFTSNLIGEYTFAGGAVSLTSVDAPVSIQSLQLSATRGQLTGTDPAPFDTLVSNTGDQWSVESLVNVVIDGTVELNVQTTEGSTIIGQFFDGAETFTFGLNRTGQPNDNFGGELVAFYPPGGGPITIVSTGGPLAVGGLELVAEPGILTQGASPGPFAFFIPNSAAPGNVTLGVLGTPVTVAGAVELDVFVSADAPIGSITATWGNGVTPTAISVFPLTTVPEPSSSLMVWFGMLGLLAVRRRR